MYLNARKKSFTYVSRGKQFTKRKVRSLDKPITRGIYYLFYIYYKAEIWGTLQYLLIYSRTNDWLFNYIINATCTFLTRTAGKFNFKSEYSQNKLQIEVLCYSCHYKKFKMKSVPFFGKWKRNNFC